MPGESLDDIRDRLRRFAAARDWEQYHTPKNLAMALAAEVGELLEPLQWLSADETDQIGDDPATAEALREELADVAIYLIRLADVLEVNLADAISEKINHNETRFPPGNIMPDGS